MQTMASNASRYDWTTWLMGIFRSFVAGGAGAIAAPIGPMLMDGKDYNLGSGGLGKVLASMGIAFLVTGLTGMGIFLKTHGAPDPIAVKEALDEAAAANVKSGTAIGKAQDAVSQQEVK